MRKTLLGFIALGAMTSSLYAGVCSDNLKYDFTFYGAADKSYVVTKNTFKTATSNFPNEKLLNATLNIDAFSLDTSADLRNGAGNWPASMVNIRNMNTVNNFFKKFDMDAGKIDTKIVEINDKAISVEIKMNGVAKVIPFTYTVENDTVKASGKLDVLDFNTNKAWAQFSAVCKGFHKGKSWSQIDINFQVPTSCK